ncbi:MAG: glycerol kinase GlpK [Lachnospiraceae bacterium]|nr:glycerol kinase GlpK [Lachnospiraceae bacterium]
MSYFLGIDQGTTLTTAVVTDGEFRILAKASRPHATFYPKPGWVEQDPEELYANCLAAVQEVCEKAGIRPSDLEAMGLDHQGESCLVWEKESGRPIYPMIIWQDRRTARDADRLNEERGDEILRVSGMRPDAYYSATKLKWILDHVDGARERMAKGELELGTFNTWFYERLSGGTCYLTEPSSACCMMLMDLKKTEWDPALISLIGVEIKNMPRIADSGEIMGETDPDCFFGARVKLAGFLTDNPASLLGGGCAGKGVLKTSYGTGSFMLFQTGEEAAFSDTLTGDCMWRLGGKPWYALRGACYTAGAAIEWLRRGVGLIEKPQDTEALCRLVKDSGDVFFVPAFVGLAAPFWDQYARGLFIGITGGTTREHIVRAVVDALTYQVAECYRTMVRDSGVACRVMRADGGMSENSFIMQQQADMLGVPVEVPAEKETAAFGSACLAGISCGILSGPEEVRNLVRVARVYEPMIPEAEREERLARWLAAVERSRGWAKE